MTKPIHLYVKTHNVTGLKYFGKTIRVDPVKYKGSGKRWLNHIKVHGYDVSTVIIGTYTEVDECLKVALAFSRDNNIVESNEWANLKVESLDGGFDHVNSIPKEVRRERYLAWRDSLSDDERKLIDSKKACKGDKNHWFGKCRSGENNPRFGVAHTDATKELISTPKRGKHIVKDALSGEVIGLVDNNHENVLSGVWVSINSGRKATDETRRILSEARKKTGIKPPSPKGKLWWNNGIDVVRSATCPGEGYVRGRKLLKLIQTQ
jgi:hypothetical protein